MPRRRQQLRQSKGTVSGKPAARGGVLSRLPRRWLYAAAAGAAALILLGNKGFRTVVKNTLLLRRIDSELAREEEDGKRLQKDISSVKTDDRALERVVRKELGYLKPGEVEYRFPPPDRKNR